MLGIDIYERYQDVSNWAAVARHGVRFCWIKASDGGTTFRTDPNRRPDALVAGARSVGIAVGLYHYAQFSPSPEAQADVLMGEVRRLGATGLPPALDLESPFSPNSAARDFAIRFLRRLVDHHRVRPAVYGNTSMFAGIRPDTWDIPGLVIWAADYGANTGTRNPDLRPYIGRADVHQYTSKGTVPGIAGRVDLNETITDALQEGDDMAGELADKVMQFMIERLEGLPDDHPFHGKHVGDVLLDSTGYARSANAKLDTLLETSGQALTPEQLQQLADLIATRVPANLVGAFDDHLRAAFARAANPEEA